MLDQSQESRYFSYQSKIEKMFGLLFVIYFGVLYSQLQLMLLSKYPITRQSFIPFIKFKTSYLTVYYCVSYLSKLTFDTFISSPIFLSKMLQHPFLTPKPSTTIQPQSTLSQPQSKSSAITPPISVKKQPRFSIPNNPLLQTGNKQKRQRNEIERKILCYREGCNGALSGILTFLVTRPIQQIRYTRYMYSVPTNQIKKKNLSLIQSFRTVYRSGGLRSFYRFETIFNPLSLMIDRAAMFYLYARMTEKKHSFFYNVFAPIAACVSASALAFPLNKLRTYFTKEKIRVAHSIQKSQFDPLIKNLLTETQASRQFFKITKEDWKNTGKQCLRNSSVFWFFLFGNYHFNYAQTYRSPIQY